MAMTWNEWLKSKRGRRGDPDFVSLDELASRVGVSRTRVIQIEGLAEAPPFPTRQKIHEALGTTEDELIALGIVRAPVVIGVGAARAEARGGEVAVTTTPSLPPITDVPTDHNPFEKNTWHWVVMQRVRQMNDEQAEDVASYAEYILTRKKAELPVIVRASTARDRVAP